jgi:hypothetical protein
VENILGEYPNLLDISSYKQAEVSSNLLTHQISIQIRVLRIYQTLLFQKLVILTWLVEI